MKNQFKNNRWLNTVPALLTAVLALGILRAEGQSIQDPPFGRPDAVVDLASRDGVELVNGQWRYHDVKIVDADSRTVGPDLKPSGAPTKTHDYEPHAGVADFDDSQWEAVDAATLDQRRSTDEPAGVADHISGESDLWVDVCHVGSVNSETCTGKRSKT